MFAIPNFITAGSGRAMANILLGLDREQFDPSVAVLQRGGRIDEELEAAGVRVYEGAYVLRPRPIHDLRRRARAAAEPFRAAAPDVWHSFHYLDDYTEGLVARAAGARYVFTKKNMSWNRRSWLLRSLGASRIVALNTDMVQHFYGDPVMRRRVRYIPRGVDTERFRPSAQTGSLRRRIGAADAPIIGTLSNLQPVKDHPTVLRALAAVPGAHLVLAGKMLYPEYGTELERLVAELAIGDRVHFIGPVDDTPAYLRELDLFVHPTHEQGEGSPVALLEAMACGAACVATDVPGNRDALAEGSGVLVTPRRPDELARVLRDLSAAPEHRKALRLAARRRVEERFASGLEVSAHVRLYEELVRS